MNCPNCNNKLTCGCQKKTASDGKQVCSGCLANYERELKSKSPTTINPNKPLKH